MDANVLNSIIDTVGSIVDNVGVVEGLSSQPQLFNTPVTELSSPVPEPNRTYEAVGWIARFRCSGIGAIMAYCRDKEFGSPDAATTFMEIMKWIGLSSFGLFFAAKAAGIAIPGGPVLADLAAAFAFGWLVSRADRC